LALFSRTQCEDIAVRRQNEQVIVTGRNGDDFLDVAGFVAEFEY
jgi:hypothetical protein